VLTLAVAYRVHGEAGDDVFTTPRRRVRNATRDRVLRVSSGRLHPQHLVMHVHERHARIYVRFSPWISAAVGMGMNATPSIRKKRFSQTRACWRGRRSRPSPGVAQLIPKSSFAAAAGAEHEHDHRLLDRARPVGRDDRVQLLLAQCGPGRLSGTLASLTLRRRLKPSRSASMPDSANQAE
jgi:hypothetical protein